MDMPENLSTTASEMVETALENCAAKNHDNDAQLTVEALRQGKLEDWISFSNCMGAQIASHLASQSTNIQSIYSYAADPQTLRETSPQKRAAYRGINLILCAEPQDQALGEHIKNLETSISQILERLNISAPQETIFPISWQALEPENAQKGYGQGLLTQSKVIHTKQIWPQEEEEEEKQTSQAESTPAIQQKEDRLLNILNSYDPALAAADRSIGHGRAIERVPPEQRGELEYHLIKLKVGLIQKLISDQLFYIDVAKKWFTIEDLAEIHQRTIGYGKIGGKAAGMMLAARILEKAGDEEINAALHVPESFFLGSDLIYIFMAMNGLMHWNDQKYKPEEDIRSEYPKVKQEFMAGSFPPEVIAELERVLEYVGCTPLVVRSSSQLEDNFGTVFAGKYDSVFCPNQGTDEERMNGLVDAIKRVYASTLKPEALLYRRSRGLEDYDERMAVLIQTVQGQQFEEYYFPQVAGVAFSRNLYRWSPEIKREEGFARLVWGLGTRAVGRVDNDYPRIVALSHPNLHPNDTAEAISYYSQHHVDLLDLESNQVKSMPIHDVLKPKYPPLRYIAQLSEDNYIRPIHMRIPKEKVPNLIVTYDEFIKRTPFVPILKKMLNLIGEHYHQAVDIEFAAQITDMSSVNPGVKISLLQCRPQPHLQDAFDVTPPKDLPDEDIVFSTRFMVPRGYLKDIRYVLFVHPNEYFALDSLVGRTEVSQVISKINAAMDKNQFICVGPGRWGSINTDLGVGSSYADIFNAAALVEISGEGIGTAPEPSLGTHFFQDLMEAQIFPLALYLDSEDVVFNHKFFYNAPNALSDWVTTSEKMEQCLRLIDVRAFRPDHHLEIVMDDETSQAIAFLAAD